MQRFTVRSLTGLLGLVAACGGATVAIDGPDAGNDAGAIGVPTSRPPPPGTAVPPFGPRPPKPPLPIGDDDDDDDQPAPSTCLDPTPIDQTKIPYRPAFPAKKGACTAKELTALGAYYKAHATDADFTVTTWMTSVTAGCAACVVTDDTAATAPAWAPIVAVGGKIDTVNRGGCIQTVSGSEACGRSYHQYQTCLVNACLAKCATSADFAACRGDSLVLKTACKDAADALTTACGGGVNKYETACKGTTYTFEGPIKVACINGG